MRFNLRFWVILWCWESRVHCSKLGGFEKRVGGWVDAGWLGSHELEMSKASKLVRDKIQERDAEV